MQFKSVSSIAGSLIILAGFATATPVAQAADIDPIVSIKPILPSDPIMTIQVTVTITPPPSKTTVFITGQTKTVTKTHKTIRIKTKTVTVKPKETNKTKAIGENVHYNDGYYCNNGEALVQCKVIRGKKQYGQCIQSTNLPKSDWDSRKYRDNDCAAACRTNLGSEKRQVLVAEHMIVFQVINTGRWNCDNLGRC